MPAAVQPRRVVQCAELLLSPQQLCDFALTPCPPAVLLLLPHAQASRGAHAGEVLSVLNSLWDATDVPDQERSHFVRMMSGSLRLHAASLEKVRGAWVIQARVIVKATLEPLYTSMPLAMSHGLAPCGLHTSLARYLGTAYRGSAACLLPLGPTVKKQPAQQPCTHALLPNTQRALITSPPCPLLPASHSPHPTTPTVHG